MELVNYFYLLLAYPNTQRTDSQKAHQGKFSFSQTKVFDIAVESTKKSSAKESIEYLDQQLTKVTSAAEKRALYIFLGSVQEQMADFTNACKNYAKAAGISAGDVENMPKKSNEQLVLDAVRCALSYGDADLANLYLNSAVRNSRIQ